MGYKGLKSVMEFRSREWLSFETLHESWMSFLQLLTQMRYTHVLDKYVLRVSTFNCIMEL